MSYCIPSFADSLPNLDDGLWISTKGWQEEVAALTPASARDMRMSPAQMARMPGMAGTTSMTGATGATPHPASRARTAGAGRALQVRAIVRADGTVRVLSVEPVATAGAGASGGTTRASAYRLRALNAAGRTLADTAMLAGMSHVEHSGMFTTLSGRVALTVSTLGAPGESPLTALSTPASVEILLGGQVVAVRHAPPHSPRVGFVAPPGGAHRDRPGRCPALADPRSRSGRAHRDRRLFDRQRHVVAGGFHRPGSWRCDPPEPLLPRLRHGPPARAHQRRVPRSHGPLRSGERRRRAADRADL